MDRDRTGRPEGERSSFAAPEAGSTPTPAADLIVDSLRVELPAPDAGMRPGEERGFEPPEEAGGGIGAQEPSEARVESPVERESPAPEATDDAAVTWHRLEASRRIRTWSRALDGRENDLESRLKRLEERVGGMLSKQGGEARTTEEVGSPEGRPAG